MPPSKHQFVPPGQSEMGRRISEKYILGKELGKGAYGTVYECQNQETGEVVAVKRVKIRELKPEQLKSLEQEVDVLKMLNHPNIVKYIATVRTRNHMHIVIQFMENGSLSQNIKKFGVFPPPLVSLFTRQVLQGLAYLHDQGVIHRDIKGANILSDKSGRVKLADFGVAIRTRGVAANNSDSVVGTPYWMAPEIIDMLPPTAACDIWSVGCTVIELLTSKPPHGDVPAAAAMYRIVSSDTVPYPDNISPEIISFLNKCFNKEPTLRPSAHDLLEHEWIRSSIGVPEPRPSTQLSLTGARDQESNQSPDNEDNPVGTPTSGNQILLPQNLSSRAKNASVTSGSAHSRSSVSSHGSQPVPRHRHSLPGQVYDSITSEQDTPTAAILPIPPSLLATGDRASWRFSMIPALSAVGEHENEDWDKEMGILANESSNQHQGIIWAGPSQRIQKDEMTRPKSMRGLEAMAQRRAVQGAFLTDSSADSSVRASMMDTPIVDMDAQGDFERAFEGDRDMGMISSPSMRNGGGSAAARKKKGIRLAKFRESADDADFGDMASSDIRGSADILAVRKERESVAEEDNTSGFASPEPAGPGDETGRSARARKAAEVQDLISKLKQPVGLIGGPLSPSPVVEAADKLVAMFKETPALKRTLLTHHGVTPLLDTLARSGEEETRAILRIVNEAADNDRSFQELLTMAGIVPILTKLVGREAPLETRKLGSILVSHFLCTSPIALHMFVACGGLSTIVALLENKGDAPPIIELAVIALDGVLRVFSETAAPQGSRRRASISKVAAMIEDGKGHGGLAGIPKNDFCLLFSKTTLLDKLASLGHRLQSEDGKKECMKCAVALPAVLAEVCNILLVFSQSGTSAKRHLAESPKALRFALSTMATRWGAIAGTGETVSEEDVDDDIDTVRTLLNTLKNLASETTCLDALDSAGVVHALVPFLAVRQEPNDDDPSVNKKLKKRRAILAIASAITEVHNISMLTLFYMLRLSPARQERAAVCGIIPLAKSAVIDRTPVKNFAMQIIVDMSHASDFARHCLYRDGALDFLVDALVGSEPFWHDRALQAIEQFLLPPSAPVPSTSQSKASTPLGTQSEIERHLLRPYVLQRFVTLFQSATNEYFESIAKTFLSMFEVSKRLAEAIGRSGLFVSEVVARLQYPKTEVKNILLKILLIISRAHTELESLLLDHNLPAVIGALNKSAKASKLVMVATYSDQLLQLWKGTLDSIGTHNQSS